MLYINPMVRTIPRSIPNTQYYWPPAIPIPNTDTEYDVIRNISVTNLFPPANVTATVIIAADQMDG